MGAIIFFSCTNNLDEIIALVNKEKLPTVHSIDIEIIQTDSARLSYRMVAAELKRFENEDNPYVEFPQGIAVYFYDDAQEVQSSVTADYARQYENEEKWIAENNVVAINQKEGNQLNTEYMVWDMKREKIHSDKFSRITTNDGVFIGKNGFEADAREDGMLTQWRIFNSEGTINVKDQ